MLAGFINLAHQVFLYPKDKEAIDEVLQTSLPRIEVIKVRDFAPILLPRGSQSSLQPSSPSQVAPVDSLASDLSDGEDDVVDEDIALSTT